MRLRQVIHLSVVFAVLFCTAGAASAHLQGIWSGSVTVNDICDTSTGEQPVQWSSPAALFVFESGDDFMANLEIERVPLFTASCQPEAHIPVVLPLFGNSPNLTTLQATIIFPDVFSADVTGTVSGANMTLDIGPGFATATLMQVDTQQQLPVHGGSFNGSFNVSNVCANGTFTESGTLEGSIFHTGVVLSGILFFESPTSIRDDPQGNCQVVQEPDFGLIFVSAHVMGNNLNGHLFINTFDDRFDDNEEIIPFNATVSGEMITGGVSDPLQGTLSFTLNRTSTGLQPVITEFRADPPTINAGEPTRLIWSTLNATSVSIDNGIGIQPTSGFVIVRPTATTTYTLTASGPGGTTTATTTVTVAGPTPARVVIGRDPAGFVQRAGEGGGRDTVTVANIGGTETTVAVSKSGDFFNVNTESVTLGPKGSPTSTREIIITGSPQPPGTYKGLITFSGAGVDPGTSREVRMLSAAPPTGTVDPRSTVARAEISTEVGQSGAGSVSFTNNGNATVQAIAVADVPWVIPESGVITIAPGQTVSVSFTVDPSKRPQDLPIGAVTGKISLVFLRGTGGGATSPGILGGGAGTSTVSVTLVYVVKPGVSPGSPPPLGAGELALFVPGVANKPRASGDLFLSNTQSTAVSDLRLYLLGSGISQTSSLPTLQANGAVALPSLVKNVFSAPVPTATTQVRSANLSNVSVAATRTNTASSAGSFSTALPVFRSDRGVTTGGRISLSGLSKSANELTDLFVQELSGTAGGYQLEFFNGSGQQVGSSSGTVTAFGFVELVDAVPTGAVSARITSTGGRLAAYGLVVNPSTGDAWLSTDPSAEDPAATAYLIPLLSAGQNAQTTLYLTNRSASTASVTVDVQTPGGKRRVASKGTTSPPPMYNVTSNVTLNPSQTTATPITQTSGYIRLTVPAGSVSAAARSIRSEGNSAFGTGLPAVPVSLALRSGETRRFAGVDDASSSSRTSAAPATFRTSLALAETNGAGATVRVTLAYTFAAGSLASAQARSTKEYPLSASQFLLIGDLARDVIGPQRTSFGDLRNMTVDVEVIDGSGRVLPFLQSIDNGSGDSLVRTE